MKTASTMIAEFIEDARGVSIEQAAQQLRLSFTKKRHEHPQTCPACGGRDGFAFNTNKNKWNCRKAGVGGQDAIGMAAHVLGLDVKRREGLLEACAAVLGMPIPDGGERESDDERAAREKRLAAMREKNRIEAERRDADQQSFRSRERNKARGIWQNAEPLDRAAPPFIWQYLRGRGCGVPNDKWLRVAEDVTYWHGQDERGNPNALHAGPAMIAPFIDAAGDVIGCHITWIDLTNFPKLRPALIDLATGAAMPSKKMRGSKKGGVIPLAGDPSARRWLGAEGIENTLAFAGCEGFRADTFYFAAGDLGNMAGPADPKSRFAHPSLKQNDKNGKSRPVMVAGPVPLFRNDGEADAMVVPEHVEQLVLLADGDSEKFMTASAMARARERHAHEGRRVTVVWPREGTDWAAMLADHDAAFSGGAAA